MVDNKPTVVRRNSTSNDPRSPRARVLVTGANGFVGRQLISSLEKNGYRVRAAVRGTMQPLVSDSRLETTIIGELSADTDWHAGLRDIDVVIHLAARVHHRDEKGVAIEACYQRTNLAGTVNLFDQAAESGVQRFVYLSSVKVNGEASDLRRFDESSECHPSDSYGRSKLAAEKYVRERGRHLAIETVIIRPPLVYGPGVKGNFIRLLGLAALPLPLPFAAITNRRSLVSLRNLCDLIVLCAWHPRAAGETYFVSDDEDLSIMELIAFLRRLMSCKRRQFYVPVAALKNFAAIVGRRRELEKITGALQVNCAKAQRELGWHPPQTVQEGLEETVGWYVGSR